ncbi:hypothetical protein ACRAVF_27295 [Bradyrhizobium oligotrophicum S58]
MPVFEIESGGKRFQVEAPDMQTAADSLGQFKGSGGGGSSFSERLQKVWDNPTPGGAIWLAKQAVEGVRNSVDAAKVSTMQPQTEEEAFQVNQAKDVLPQATMQAASVFSPAAPGGTGGLFAAPMVAAKPAAAPVAAAGGAAPAAVEGGRVVEAAQRLGGVVGNDINVPRAVASDNMATQRIGQGLRNLPVVGDAIPKATGELVDQLGGATRTVADQYGQGSGPNVASRIRQGLQDSAEAETQAATEAARRSDEALQAAWRRDQEAAHAQIAQRETQSLEQVRAAVGDMSPQDMGATLIQRLRANEGAARARKDALYDQAGRANAAVRADEVGRARAFVAQRVEDQGRVVDPVLTPAANRMMDELQRLAELEIPNRAVGARVPATGTEERVGVSVQGIEQARKRLNSMRQAANNDADRGAARAVMNAFDDWQAQAFENALLSGDDTALQAFRSARAANTAWRQRFFNDETDAGKFVTRIVTGEVTPQEVANYLIGSGQVGAKGVASRLLTEIAHATDGDAEAMGAIRGAVWNKLSQATEGTGTKAPDKVARDIMEFLNGSGRDVANRVLDEDQRRLMRAYAETLRSGQDARALIGDVAEATRPGAMPVQPGPMKQIADAVIGKGRKSDEALFSAIDSYAKSGGRGDIATLGKLVRALPQEDRQDLAGAIIRNLGVSPRTGQFSPDVFVSQWQTYTPQAKAVLFGNAGPQRQALDDIAMISTRLKDVGSKFGNPSGTSQNDNFAKLSAGLLAAPLTTLTTVIGGSAAAKLLAAPAGTASAAKWARAYEVFLRRPTAATLANFSRASRNLSNTAAGLGVKSVPGEMVAAAQQVATALSPDQAGQSRTNPRRQ